MCDPSSVLAPDSDLTRDAARFVPSQTSATGSFVKVNLAHLNCFDPASYPRTSGVYNLMMSGGEYGSQKGRGTEPSVHE